MRKVVRHGVWWAMGRKIIQWKDRRGFTQDQWGAYYGVILESMMIAEYKEAERDTRTSNKKSNRGAAEIQS